MGSRCKNLLPLFNNFMMRVYNSADNNCYTDPPNVITLAAATATILLPSEQNTRLGEIAGRKIFNSGANRLYYSINTFKTVVTAGVSVATAVCDATLLYHGYLEAGNQADFSTDKQIVCGYSTGGTTVAITVTRRTDLSKLPTIVPASNP